MDENQLNKEFEELYVKKLAPRIVPLEQERVVVDQISNRNKFIGFLCFVGSFIGVWLTQNLYCFVLVVPAIIMFSIEKKRQNKFRLKLKQQLLMEIFSLFGTFQYCTGKELITKKEIMKTGLFPKCDHKRDNDSIIGTYNGMHIAIVETELTHTEIDYSDDSHDQHNVIKDFRGLIIKTVLNKPYTGRILLYQKAIGQKGQKQAIKSMLSEEVGEEQADKIVNSKTVNAITGVLAFKEKPLLKKLNISGNGLNIDLNSEIHVDKNLNKVTLEDPEFSQFYDVYSDDQVEARYILTPTFIERLKNIREVIGAFHVHCYVENQCITLFIENPRDFFEIGSFNESINNKKIYQDIFVQLITIFNLIHYFKLDKKLGL